MKIFISSIISGFEPFRAAARDAVVQLGHEAVMAEDFGAQPSSPQAVCLQGVRSSSLVVLVLGAGYGAKQASGFSATHEEFKEAQDRRPIIAFVQDGVTRDPDQTDFVREVEAWGSGFMRAGFSSPDDLRKLVTRHVHEWELASMAGPVDEREMLARALALVPDNPREYSTGGVSLVLTLAPGPRQPVLRPSELERASLRDDLLKDALFGPDRIFTTERPNRGEIENHALVLDHGDGLGRVRLDGEGNLTVQLPLEKTSFGLAIEENVAEVLAQAVAYAASVLDRIDPLRRLTHIALAAALLGRESLVWRTRREQDASPNSYSMGMGFGRERKPVHLSPAHRPRPALSHKADSIVEDLVTLLRREWKSG